MESGLPAAGIPRAARAESRSIPRLDWPSILALASIHRITHGIDHGRCVARARQQMSQPEVSHAGLLHGHATARFQRSEQFSVQPENALHLPVGSDLSRRIHETHLHVLVVAGDSADHR